MHHDPSIGPSLHSSAISHPVALYFPTLSIFILICGACFGLFDAAGKAVWKLVLAGLLLWAIQTWRIGPEFQELASAFLVGLTLGLVARLGFLLLSPVTKLLSGVFPQEFVPALIMLTWFLFSLHREHVYQRRPGARATSRVSTLGVKIEEIYGWIASRI